MDDITLSSKSGQGSHFHYFTDSFFLLDKTLLPGKKTPPPPPFYLTKETLYSPGLRKLWPHIDYNNKNLFLRLHINRILWRASVQFLARFFYICHKLHPAWISTYIFLETFVIALGMEQIIYMPSTLVSGLLCVHAPRVQGFSCPTFLPSVTETFILLPFFTCAETIFTCTCAIEVHGNENSSTTGVSL